MIPEFWTTRSEAYLAAINGETVELPEPQSRMELYLAKIAGVDVEVPEPQTRSELFLAAILGESVELPAPRSRVEFYLAKIAGLDVETPEPQTRIDEYLAEWAENGSGWSWETVTGVSPLALAYAAAHAVKSLIQTGKCVDSGGDIYCNNGKLVAVDDELPAGYKRVLGFSMNNNAYWKITDFPLYGSDTLRFSFEATDACNIIGAYSGSASGNNYSLYAAASSNYLRYKNGAYNSAIDFNTRYDVEITPTGSHGMKTDSTWTAQEFTTPTDLCIGTTSTSASSAKLKGKMYGNVEVVGRAKFIPCERASDNVLGYYDIIGKAFYEQASGYAGAVSLGYDHFHETVLSVVGTPEVITLGTQTATVADLFSVNDVADEQDIISGVVTRRVEVTVSGGVITISPLATPVTENVTPQPLNTAEGSNTLSWTAEVSGTTKTVTYAKAPAPQGGNLVGSAIVGTATAG